MCVYICVYEEDDDEQCVIAEGGCEMTEKGTRGLRNMFVLF